MTCPSCGTPVPEGARFCPTCGHALASRGDERRIASVVFADIVGFTTLAEASDPERVKELVDRCFERLAVDVRSFGGRVDKIVGDALVALFGAPTAHEDDPERAVRAALRMQATVAAYASEVEAPVQVRIGVNTGEVLVGALRAGGDYTAMGDVVNTAQRLQAGAEPGSVVVGPATYAATHEVVAYRHLGHVAVRGRDEAVEAWVAVEPLLPPGYRPRRAGVPVVGRDPELDLLQRAVDVAIRRRRAQLVVLVGEAGLGKSRLADEVARTAEADHGAQISEGRCVPYGEANVWWPVAEALRQALAIGAEADLGEATRVATAAVGAVVEGAAEVDRIAEGVLYLLGYEVPLRDIDPGRARSEATDALIAYVAAAARRAPVVIVLSDLHWADPAVLDLVDALLERLRRCPFVLVATSRDPVGERWTRSPGRHNALVTHLDPLDDHAARHLLDALGASDLDPALRDVLIDRAGGNPLFLEELVALVGDAGEQAATLLGGEPLGGLPDTLRGLVAARLDGLDDVARTVVEDAAVWGRSGKVVVLATMGELTHDIADVGPALQALVAADVLELDGPHWSFRSDLVREVAYSMLTKADRARRHAGIAWYLEREQPVPADTSDRTVDVIAHHWAAAAALAEELGPVAEVPHDVAERALGWLEEAAHRAHATQLPQVAVQLCDQALDLVADGEPARRVRLLLCRAQAHVDLRQLDEARADADAAARHAGEAGSAATARVLLVRGDIAQKAGDLPAADEALGQAAEQLAVAGDGPGEAEALRLLGLTRLLAGEGDAETALAGALARSRSLGDSRGVAWALQHLAWISFVAGRSVEAEDRLERSAATFSELGDRGGLAWAKGLLAYVRFHRGDRQGATELGEQILHEARHRGDRWGEGMMLTLLGSTHLWSGRGFDAVRVDEEALELFRDLGDSFGAGQSTVALGRALVTTGSVVEGLALLADELAAAEAGGAHAANADALRVGLVESLVQVGEPERATALLSAHGPLEPSAGLGAVEASVAQALVHLQEGDGATAEALLCPLIALTSADGAAGTSAYALSALALARAQQGAAPDELAGVLDRVEASPTHTYLDRFVAATALALTRVVREGADAVAGLDALDDLVAGTDDAVAAAVAALAREVALDATGLPGSDAAREAADERWAVLGVDGHGWRCALRQVAEGAGRAIVPAPSAC